MHTFISYASLTLLILPSRALARAGCNSAPVGYGMADSCDTTRQHVFFVTRAGVLLCRVTLLKQDLARLVSKTIFRTDLDARLGSIL